MDPVIAYVQIGPVEIAYSRGGRGAPLILVASRALQTSLESVLSEHFRVISPVDATSSPWSAMWMRAFLDALGLPPPRVVADAESAAVPIEMLLDDPSALERLVVLCDGQSSHCVQLRSGDNARLVHMHPAARVFGPADFAALLRFLR
jgi:hypothetical protein